MKYIKPIRDSLIIIYLLIIIYFKYFNTNKYDLNKDGQVDIRDMLVIQKYILDGDNICKK